MRKRHTQKRKDSRSQTTRSTRRRGSQTQDEIADWLRDAYAMEKGMELSLQKQRDNEELNPEVRERAGAHLSETQRHADLVRSALRSLGTDASVVKTGLGTLVQAARGMSSAFARDERIKDMLDAYAMENFEIACYTALEAAAQRAGLNEIAQVCRTILPDEHRMAVGIIQSLPDEVTAYLFESEAEMNPNIAPAA